MKVPILMPNSLHKTNAHCGNCGKDEFTNRKALSPLVYDYYCIWCGWLFSSHLQVSEKPTAEKELMLMCGKCNAPILGRTHVCERSTESRRVVPRPVPSFPDEIPVDRTAFDRIKNKVLPQLPQLTDQPRLAGSMCIHLVNREQCEECKPAALPQIVDAPFGHRTPAATHYDNLLLELAMQKTAVIHAFIYKQHRTIVGIDFLTVQAFISKTSGVQYAASFTNVFKWLTYNGGLDDTSANEWHKCAAQIPYTATGRTMAMAIERAAQKVFDEFCLTL